MQIGLSDWLLDVHRDARALPSRQYCQKTLERLQERLRFDSAFLYRGATPAGRAELHAFYLFRQPDSLLTRYLSERLYEVDPLIEGIINDPGKAIRISKEDCPLRFHSFLEDHGQLQLVSLTVKNHPLQLAAGLSLYRRDANAPFTAAEGATLEDAVPHIVEGWTESLLGELQRSAEERDLPFAVGVLTADLTLTAAHREFETVMALDWPDWRGPQLPGELRVHVERSSAQPWKGSQVVVYSQRIDGGFLLKVRHRHAFDALAPRKQAVALAFATGASQTSVARTLHLSPSAVNNYLGDVYRELHLSNKVELAMLVARLSPQSASH